MDGIAIFEDYLRYEAIGSVRAHRGIPRTRSDPWKIYNDEEFRQRYRFSKPGVDYI